MMKRLSVESFYLASKYMSSENFDLFLQTVFMIVGDELGSLSD